MADNYLERRMEDLRAGKLAPAVPKSRVGARRYVLIIEDDQSTLEAKVKECRAKGISTAFAGTDRAAGYRLAQLTGARYCPVDDLTALTVDALVADLRRHWRTENIEIFH